MRFCWYHASQTGSHQEEIVYGCALSSGSGFDTTSMTCSSWKRKVPANTLHDALGALHNRRIGVVQGRKARISTKVAWLAAAIQLALQRTVLYWF